MTKEEIKKLDTILSMVSTLKSSLKEYFEDTRQLSIKTYSEDVEKIQNALMKLKK